VQVITMKPQRPLALLVMLWMVSCGRHEPPAPNPPQAPPTQPVERVEPVSYDAAAQAASAGGDCALDTVGGKPAKEAQVKQGSVARFVGWMGDARKQVPSSALIVLAKEGAAFAYAIKSGNARPDVAATLKAPDLQMSGYTVDLSFANVPAGTYRASIVIPSAPATTCDLHAQVRVVV
jgi:hypothetical protein